MDWGLSNHMSLREVIQQLPAISNDTMIYAEKINGEWKGESRAAIFDIPEEEDAFRNFPMEIDGLTHMIYSDTAKEAIEVWEEWNRNHNPTPEQMLKAVVHYA